MNQRPQIWKVSALFLHHPWFLATFQDSSSSYIWTRQWFWSDFYAFHLKAKNKTRLWWLWVVWWKNIFAFIMNFMVEKKMNPILILAMLFPVIPSPSILHPTFLHPIVKIKKSQSHSVFSVSRIWGIRGEERDRKKWESKSH